MLNPDDATFEEKRTDGCGDLYFTMTDINYVIKVMSDLLCNQEEDIFEIETEGFRISAERDAFDEDGFHLVKEKIE